MKRKTRLIILTAIFLLLLFTFFGHRHGEQKNFFTDNAVMFIFEPVEGVYHSITGFFGDFTNKYIFLFQTETENQQLREEVRLLTLKNDSLEHELKLSSSLGETQAKYSYLHKALLPVKVVGYDPFVQSKTMWIDAGEDNLVKVNSVVIAKTGLVGRVIQVFAHSSKVLLMTDSFFSVDAMNKRTNLRCLIQGFSDAELQTKRLPYLSQVEFFEKGQDMQNGDELVTSGIGGIFPQGIPVGRIANVEMNGEGYFSNSLVVPAVDFAKVHEMYILLDLPVEKSKVKSKK